MWKNKKYSYERFLTQSTANGEIKTIAKMACERSEVSAPKERIACDLAKLTAVPQSIYGLENFFTK